MGWGEARHRETCTLLRVQTGEIIYPRAQATFLPALAPSPPGLEPQKQNDHRIIAQTRTPKKMKWSTTDDYTRTTNIWHSIKKANTSSYSCDARAQNLGRGHEQLIGRKSRSPAHSSATWQTPS